MAGIGAVNEMTVLVAASLLREAASERCEHHAPHIPLGVHRHPERESQPQPNIEAMKSVALGSLWEHPGVGVRYQTKGTTMDRRTLLLGLLGGLAVAPAIIAAASSVEAAPLPEAQPPAPQPLRESVSHSAPTEADLETVEADWSRAARRVARRTSRRVSRRRY